MYTDPLYYRQKSRIRKITGIKYELMQSAVQNIGEPTFELITVAPLIVSCSYLKISEKHSLSTDIPDSSLLIPITLSFLSEFNPSLSLRKTSCGP